MEKSADHIFLDRIDIQYNITPVPFKDLSKVAPGESSEEIRKRVLAARHIQTERFDKYYAENRPVLPAGAGRVFCNAQMTDRMIHHSLMSV